MNGDEQKVHSAAGAVSPLGVCTDFRVRSEVDQTNVPMGCLEVTGSIHGTGHVYMCMK